MNTNSPTTDRICQAAIRTVTRDGLLAMTLDNVAREAGVSKGGLMYHFPTKELLVSAMLTYFGEQAERMMLERIAADPEPRRRWARAMIGCLFPDETKTPATTETEDALSPRVVQQFMLSVIAAAVNNPGIFAPLRAVGERLRARLLSDPDDGLEQLILWLAVDGLFLWRFVGLIDPADPLFQEIGAALRTRCQPAQPTSDSPALAPVRQTKKVLKRAQGKGRGRG